MTRITARTLFVCLLLLPTAPFAFSNSVYPLTGLPDISMDGIAGTSAGGAFTNGSALTLDGTLEYITDVPGTYCNSGGACAIFPTLTFSATSGGFTVTGENTESTGSITYLAGNIVAGSYSNPGGGVEYGELFTVTADNVPEWSAVEFNNATNSGTQGATNLLGDTVFIDFDSSAADADIEPYVTPEPTTLTLLCSGLAAGLLRKRLARKRA